MIIPSPSGSWYRALQITEELNKLLGEMRLQIPGRELASLADVHGRSLEAIRASVTGHWEQAYWEAATARPTIVVPDDGVFIAVLRLDDGASP